MYERCRKECVSMKELYERPMIDEIIFDTKAVMNGALPGGESIEDAGEL